MIRSLWNLSCLFVLYQLLAMGFYTNVNPGFILLGVVSLWGIFRIWRSRRRRSYKTFLGKKRRALRGETVKSIGEQKIADYLYNRNIQYIYEPRIKEGWLLKKTVARPDFYLPDFHCYIEYFGMMDVPSYRFHWGRKKEIYQSQRLTVINLYPNDLRRLDDRLRFLKQKPQPLSDSSPLH